MREILFRGKRTETKNWLEGSLLIYDDGDCDICSESGMPNELFKYAVDPETVGQYTGLIDKNGTKIFEGDIVTTDIARPYMIVEFRDGCFMFNCNDGGKDYYDIMLPIEDEPHTNYKYGEVIGNIHDNPELADGGHAMTDIHCELYHDNFQNFKRYNIPKAQLVIADIPYNLGENAYASNPMWYNDGDNSNGESDKAKKAFFNTDYDFRIAEYMHFCSRLLKKEPKEKGQAPAMIVFCAFDQDQMVIEYGRKYGFMHHYPIFFVKNYSAQVLKANMKIVGATEHAIVLYRDKLPKFRNNGKMVFDWFEWRRDSKKDYPKIHPTQKPVGVLKRLIGVFTDPDDVVIDPCAGSGSTLRAAYELGRNSYGFEVDRKFYTAAKEKMLTGMACGDLDEHARQMNLFLEEVT